MNSRTNTNYIKPSTRQVEQVIIKQVMPLQDAEKVIWQGAGPQEPMGKLVEEGRLTAKDLGWAMENAYNPRVRVAARTLLAYYLGKPETIEITHRYGPHVFGDSTYLEDKQYESLFNAVIYVMAALIVGLLLAAWLLSGILQELSQGVPLSTVLVAALIVLGIAVLVLSPVIWWLRRRFLSEIENTRNYRAGREGEEWVLEHLRSSLDDRWTIFRNLSVPGTQADTDLILVGPSGVYALEVKSYTNTVRSTGGAWQRQEKGRWLPLRPEPTTQAAGNAARLSDFLKRQGIVQWVQPTVVLARPQPITNFEQGKVPIWFPFLVPLTSNRILPTSTRTPCSATRPDSPNRGASQTPGDATHHGAEEVSPCSTRPPSNKQSKPSTKTCRSSPAPVPARPR